MQLSTSFEPNGEWSQATARTVVEVPDFINPDEVAAFAAEGGRVPVAWTMAKEEIPQDDLGDLVWPEDPEIRLSGGSDQQQEESCDDLWAEILPTEEVIRLDELAIWDQALLNAPEPGFSQAIACPPAQ